MIFHRSKYVNLFKIITKENEMIDFEFKLYKI